MKEIFKKTLLCLTNKRLKKLKYDKETRNHYLFSKAIHKINNEFDAINLLKMMKQVKLMSRILLNPAQKLLLGFQKKYVLDSSDSDQHRSSDDDTKLIEKMRSDNPFVKIMALGKVNKTIRKWYSKDKPLKVID